MRLRLEDRARETIDRQLTEAGWTVQDAKAMNLHAGRGVAVREYPLKWGRRIICSSSTGRPWADLSDPPKLDLRSLRQP